MAAPGTTSPLLPATAALASAIIALGAALLALSTTAEAGAPTVAGPAAVADEVDDRVETGTSEATRGSDAAASDRRVSGDGFRIVDRESWGARFGRGRPMGPVDEVVVHHFKRPNVRIMLSPSGEARIMRRIDRIHAQVNGWSGFGYHFVVFQSGRVYEGRGWGRTGAHTVGVNEDSIGIAFAIDGDLYEPTAEAWAAAEELVARGVADGHLSADVRISGHRNHADKSCPGERIQPRIQRLSPRT
jgi:peptidoglycan recognition protein